jgi:ABC-type lipoprotein release transport system permease subunit
MFSEAHFGADVVVTGRSSYGLVGAVDLDEAEEMEHVESSARAFVAVPFTGRINGERTVGISDLFPIASADGEVGTTVEKWKMLEGRPANPNRVDEATASFVLAERLGLEVGDTLEMRFFRGRSWPQTVGALLEHWPVRIESRHGDDRVAAAPPDGPSVNLRITGIEASPMEFPPLLNDLAPILHLTPEFARRHQNDVVGSDISYMRLARGYDLRSFQAAVERNADGPVSFVVTRENHSAKVQRSVHAEAVALAIVAGLVAFAGAVGVAQALTRQTFLESADDPVLRALGMRDRDLRGVDIARALLIAAGGAALGCLVAIFGSQYALLGLARKAELNRGAHVDVPVLAVGVAVVVIVMAGVALVASRAARRETRSDDQSRLATEKLRGPRIAGTSAREVPVVPALGLRFAFQRGRAPRAAPAWTAILGTALTVSMLAFAFTFVANLDRELSEPSRYGWNWHVKLGQPNLPELASAFTPPLADDPLVASLSEGVVTQIDFGATERVDVLGLRSVKGNALPTIVEGRAPRENDEIALGGRSMEALDTGIGDFVNARIGLRTATLRVVGKAIFPEFGDAGQLGTGALMTEAGVIQLSPDSPRNTFLVGFRGDRNARAEERALRSAVEPMPVRTDARPQDLVNLSRGNGLLGTLSLMLAALAFVMLAHVLATAVQSRRRDFAVLRTLGMKRSQIWGTVGWHAATLVTAALVIGLPIGVLAGRLTWSAFATRLGVLSDPMTSLGPIVLAVIGGAVVGTLAAIGPAWLAGRGHAAEVLHSSE